MIFGAVIDEAAGDNIRVTVIATGFDSEPPEPPPVAEPRRSRVSAGNAPVPSSTRRSEPPDDGGRQPLTLDKREREEFAIPDEVLDIPDFLKNR